MSSEDARKKLKQGRLPFSPVDQKCSKKRSLSHEEESTKASKFVCADQSLSSQSNSCDNISPCSAIKRKLSKFEFCSSEKVKKSDKENLISEEISAVINTKTSEIHSKTSSKIKSKTSSEIHPKASSEISMKISSDFYSKKHNEAEEISTDCESDGLRNEISGGHSSNKNKCDELKRDTSNSSGLGSSNSLQSEEKCKKGISKKAPSQVNLLNKMFKKIGEKKSKRSDEDEEIIALDSPITTKKDSSQFSNTVINTDAKGFDPDISGCEELEPSGSEFICTNVKEDMVSVAVTSDESFNTSFERFTDSDCNSPKIDSPISMSPRAPIDKTSLVTKNRKLTPFQKKKREEMLQKRMEREHLLSEKKKEKERIREEKLKKRAEEIETKKRVKEELLEKKEQEMMKKEQEKEEKRQKKEQEREEKRQKKDEEKLKKEEEKQQKEDERKRKEEERLQALEEEREKQAKLKAKFAQFFVPKKPSSAPSDSPITLSKTVLDTENRYFSVFQVKDNMKVAPLIRKQLSEDGRHVLDSICSCSLSTEVLRTYLEDTKNASYHFGKASKTFPLSVVEESDDECEVLSDLESDDVTSSLTTVDVHGTDKWSSSQDKRRMKAKLLQFCENSRPAYYGTWQKTSRAISGRKPFAKDIIFDYEYDSDEDWEDVENGESLSDSENDAEEGGDEELNQYEVDNEFFVPHGYLSDGEGDNDDGDGDSVKDDTANDALDEDEQKEKLKQKQEEFELEMKQKTKHLKPKVFGCVWLGDSSSHQAYEQLLKVLWNYEAKPLLGSLPINVYSKDEQSLDSPSNIDEEEDDSSKKFLKTFPEEAIPDLIRLVHGNRRSKLFMVREFFEFWKRKQRGEIVGTANCSKSSPNAGSLAMRKILQKIQEIGQYERMNFKGAPLKYKCWNVSIEFRSKYGMEDLSPVNEWTYILTKEPKTADAKEETPSEDKNTLPSTPTPPPKTPSGNLITKFTKVLDEDEKRKLSTPVPVYPNRSTPKSVQKGSLATSTPSNSSANKNESLTPINKAVPRKGSLVQLFKNQSTKDESTTANKNTADFDCITLE